jgi:hypothetical protein
MRTRRTSSYVAHTSSVPSFSRWSIALSALAVFALCACGGESDRYSPAAADDEPVKIAAPAAVVTAEGGAGAGTCTSGDARECKVMLGQHGNVVNCFVGMQLCEDEAWGPCQSAPAL